MSIKQISDASFKASILPAGITMVDFTANWCPPCKVLLPILEELDQELGDSVSILKLNVDDSPKSSAEYGVLSMPTVILFKDGQPMEKLVGLSSKSAYKNLISRYS
jgi:thioredoxin 1